MDYRGSTALVTGASSGIGTALAEALAARGADVVLVARSTDTLDAIAADLRRRHGVRAEVVTADLTEPDAAERIRAEVDRRGLAVDILVNNAGFGSAGTFHRVPAERSRREVALDVTAVVDLTHQFLPDMADRRRGAVLNVASTAAYQPVPNMAVYGASKAFVLSFSEALWVEYRRLGVRVAAVCPGPVNTAFFDQLGTDRAQVGQLRTPAQVAVAALRALDRGRPRVTPGLVNAAVPMLSRLLPRRVLLGVTARLLAEATPA